MITMLLKSRFMAVLSRHTWIFFVEFLGFYYEQRERNERNGVVERESNNEKSLNFFWSFVSCCKTQHLEAEGMGWPACLPKRSSKSNGFVGFSIYFVDLWPIFWSHWLWFICLLISFFVILISSYFYLISLLFTNFLYFLIFCKN